MGTVRPLDVEGYIAAPVLPLRDDGAIDLDAMERYVRWIADDGPKALVVNSSAGEGELLYPEERAQVLERVVAAVGTGCPSWPGSSASSRRTRWPRRGRRGGPGRRGCWCFRREPSVARGSPPRPWSSITAPSSGRASCR